MRHTECANDRVGKKRDDVDRGFSKGLAVEYLILMILMITMEVEGGLDVEGAGRRNGNYLVNDQRAV